MKIAMAHEWLTNWAGSERVLNELVSVARPTQLTSSIVNREFARKHFADLPIRALWPSSLPDAASRWTRYALPMMAAWATTKIEADALLVSSHFAAHGATIRFDGPSIVYYHTPARIIWRPDLERARLSRAAGRMLDTGVASLRRYDRYVSRHPTVALANSHSVAARVADAYRRPAEVLHPPVDVARWSSIERAEPRHFLWLGRLVAYKRPDIAVEAARRSGLPLVVVGDGPERAALERTAPANVHFLGRASEAEVRNAVAGARALIFPGEEDFGIAPVEALAAGVPVIAYDAGGARDYITPDLNGMLVPTQNPAGFARSMQESTNRTWCADELRRSAQRFDIPAFRSGLRRVLDRVLGRRWAVQ
jgi:glycosyltransferase involved in cell wall biosynthesis